MGSQPLRRPVLRIEANRNRVCLDFFWPFHDGALDQAGVGHHQGFGAGGIFDGRLSACIELAPCGALAIEQCFPSDNLYPMVNAGLWNALFFEIVKCVCKALICQPSSGFFDRIAIGNTVNLDAEKGRGWCFH